MDPRHTGKCSVSGLNYSSMVWGVWYHHSHLDFLGKLYTYISAEVVRIRRSVFKLRGFTSSVMSFFLNFGTTRAVSIFSFLSQKEHSEVCEWQWNCNDKNPLTSNSLDSSKKQKEDFQKEQNYALIVGRRQSKTIISSNAVNR